MHKKITDRSADGRDGRTMDAKIIDLVCSNLSIYKNKDYCKLRRFESTLRHKTIVFAIAWQQQTNLNDLVSDGDFEETKGH